MRLLIYAQVTDGRRVIRVSTGHPGMQLIIATGCTVTALITAFLAANPPDLLMAAAHALCIYGCAASLQGHTMCIVPTCFVLSALEK